MVEVSRMATRRGFLKAAGTALVGAAAAEGVASAASGASAESHVATLFGTLTPEQRRVVAFPWDHTDPRRGLLRTFVANNWQITRPAIDSEFFSLDQKDLIRAIYEGLYSPEWVPRIDAQLADDAGHDGVWDNWRLEGPSFVWSFRGSPHVHVWVNVASDPSVATNTG